jgi:endonuclease/exonuclease/phosphatase family metal-dependent hydrolase
MKLPMSIQFWRRIAVGLLIVLIGLVIWDGVDRRAADATKPLARGPSSLPGKRPPQTLKIASFNFHSGKGRDGKTDLKQAEKLIADSDFVGLYEVRASRISVFNNQAEELTQTDYRFWLFAPTERQWWHEHFGNGIVHRYGLPDVVRIPLDNTRGKAFRNALLSTIELQDGRVRVLSTHIDSTDDREKQLKTVIGLFLSLQSPCVLMGDLNTVAADPQLDALRKIDGVISPLHEQIPDLPPANIDWIFTRGLRTLSAERIENDASDHPIVKAELALP